MKLLIATILIIMGLYLVLFLLQEYLEDKKLQQQQDEIKKKYHE